MPLSSVRLLGRHLLADVLAAAAAVVAGGVTPDAMTRAVEGFTRPRARAGTGRRDRRREVRQRLEGHQRRGGAAGDRELRRAASCVILGGRFKGGDFARSRDAAARARRARSWRSARRAADSRGAGGRSCRCTTRGIDARRGADARSQRRRRAAWCCWRRRARASTCSATTRSADGCSSRKSRRLAEEMERDA